MLSAGGERHAPGVPARPVGDRTGRGGEGRGIRRRRRRGRRGRLASDRLAPDRFGPRRGGRLFGDGGGVRFRLRSRTLSRAVRAASRRASRSLVPPPAGHAPRCVGVRSRRGADACVARARPPPVGRSVVVRVDVSPRARARARDGSSHEVGPLRRAPRERRRGAGGRGRRARGAGGVPTEPVARPARDVRAQARGVGALRRLLPQVPARGRRKGARGGDGGVFGADESGRTRRVDAEGARGGAAEPAATVRGTPQVRARRGGARVLPRLRPRGGEVGGRAGRPGRRRLRHVPDRRRGEGDDRR